MNILNKIFKRENNATQSKTMQKPQLNKSFYDEIAKINDVEGFYQTLSKLANPDIVLKKTGKGIECLRLIENMGDVATCVDSRKAGVLALNWKLKHHDEEFKDFYVSLVSNLDIYTLISDILNAPLYGYQPIEINWALVDGYVVPSELIAKPQEWFFYSSERKLCFRKKGLSSGLAIEDASKKILCPRHKPSYMNPYGIAVLSRCFWDVAFIKGGFEFWVKFMEKYGMPFLIGKHPENVSEDEKNNLLNMLIQMVQDAVAVIPDNSTLEIKEATGKSASADIYEKFIILCQKNIAKNILGQTLTTDVGNVGSLAAGKVHAEVRDDIVHSDLRLVVRTINQLFKWIHELNFNEGNPPELEFYEDEDVNQDIANRDKTVSELGVKFTKKYLMKTFNYEEDDIELIDDVSPDETKNFSEQDKIDELTTSMASGGLEYILDKNINRIIQEFSEVKDSEKAMEQLSNLYPEMDFSELEETLAKSIFLAYLLGKDSVHD